MRPRKTNKEQLPPCIYHKHGAYWEVKKGKWRRLGKTLPVTIVPPKGEIPDLIDRAMPTILSGVSQNTKKQYQQIAKRLKNSFKDYRLKDVTQGTIVILRDQRPGKPNMSNRMVSLIRQVFNYALDRQLIPFNPAVGVRPAKENKRKRLISYQEYEAIYNAAVPRLKVIMALQYHTGQRISDVLKIRASDLLDEGIRFEQQKTGKILIVRWTPELRKVVATAKELHGNVRALTLLHNRRGKAPDYRSVHLQWKTAREAAGVQDARINDIRAMSLTAAKRQGKSATALAGHSTESMTVRYLRDREIPVVDGPELSKTG
jgi:integrase